MAPLYACLGREAEEWDDVEDGEHAARGQEFFGRGITHSRAESVFIINWHSIITPQP